MDRRTFLTTGAAGLAALAADRSGAAQEKSSPGERVTVAVMGVRGRGRGLAQSFAGLPDAEVAYLCDVDENVVSPALNSQFSKASIRNPARDMISRMSAFANGASGAVSLPNSIFAVPAMVSPTSMFSVRPFALASSSHSDFRS